MRNLTFKLSLIFIFIIPWEGLVRFPTATSSKIVGLLVGGLWFATIVVTRQLRKPTPFHLVLCLFTLWNGMSVFWSADPKKTAAHFGTWLQLLLLAMILWDLYTTRPALLAGLQAYVLGAYVAFGSAFVNFLRGQAFYTNYQRFSAGDTNPDGFGFIMALGIPLAWYLASLKPTGRMGRLLKFANYAYILAAFMGIALSGTRTALIASLVGTAFGLATLTRLRLLTRIAIFVVMSSIVLVFIPYLQTLESFQRLGTTGTELASGTLNNRTNNWSEGLASFTQHPLLGVGGNMYRTVNSLQKDSLGKVGHNSYISVLVELGLIGFTLFLIILIITFTQALTLPKWQSLFCLTMLAVWGLGAFTLTWEARKSTWLIMSFVIINAALGRRREKLKETAPLSVSAARQVNDSRRQFLPRRSM